MLIKIPRRLVMLAVLLSFATFEASAQIWKALDIDPPSKWRRSSASFKLGLTPDKPIGLEGTIEFALSKNKETLNHLLIFFGSDRMEGSGPTETANLFPAPAAISRTISDRQKPHDNRLRVTHLRLSFRRYLIDMHDKEKDLKPNFFVSGGIGLYKPSTGNPECGWNFEVGVTVPLPKAMLFEITGTYHWAENTAADMRFFRILAGVRYRFGKFPTQDN